MRKLIYSIGVTLFLAFLTFHVTTSLTNPFYGVSMEALAQGSGSGGSGDHDEKCTSQTNCGLYQSVITPDGEQHDYYWKTGYDEDGCRRCCYSWAEDDEGNREEKPVT